MTEISLDPDQLTNIASQLRSVQSELADLAAGVSGACCCEVPQTTSAYLDSELGSIGASINEAASGYALAADDAANRANVIATDQSLSGAMSAAYGGPEVAAYGGPEAVSTSESPVSTAGWLDAVSGDGSSSWTGVSTADWTGGIASPAGGTDPAAWSYGGNWIGDMAANNQIPSLINTSGWAAGIGVGPAGTGGGVPVGINPSNLFAFDPAATTLAPVGPDGQTLTAVTTTGDFHYADGGGHSYR